MKEIILYRISLWDSRKPSGAADSQYTTGNKTTAIHSASQDMAAMGENSWVKVEQLHSPAKTFYFTKNQKIEF